MRRVTFTGRKLPLNLRNIAEREAAHQGTWNIRIHAMRCSRGCAHGNARFVTESIRLYLASKVDHEAWQRAPQPRSNVLDRFMRFDLDENKYLLIHELAHLADSGTGHTDSFYREAIRIARREGCLRGFLDWQGRKAKAYWRRAKAAA